MSPRFLLVAVVGAVGMAAAAAQARPQHDAALGRVGNAGATSLRVSAAMALALRREGVAVRARVMATRNGKQFVRLGAGGDHCFGVGPAGAAQVGFTCSDAFPSAQRPILDLSTFGADDGGPIHVLDAEGFAADGVASIALQDADGTILARAPVRGNVYSFTAPPQSAVRVAALDGKGSVLFAVPK